MSKDSKSETPEVSTDIAKAFAEALQKGMADGIAMANLSKQAAAPVIVSRERCADCGQLKAACKSKHEMLVVWPHDNSNAKYFSGIILNSVRYRSNGPGHRICVPAVNDIPGELSKWE